MKNFYFKKLLENTHPCLGFSSFQINTEAGVCRDQGPNTRHKSVKYPNDQNSYLVHARQQQILQSIQLVIHQPHR